MSDEARMWTELGRLGEEPLPAELSDAEIVAAALAGLAEAPAAEPTPVPVAPAKTPSRVGVVVGVVLALAAAVLLGWWLVPRTGLLARGDDSHQMAPSVLDDEEAGGQASERKATAERSRSVRPAPAVAPEPALGGSTGAAETETETDAPDVPDVADSESGDTEGAPARRAARRPSAPRTAAALLEQAQHQLSEGDPAAAMTSYERLVERFPASAEAKTAHVSLGRMELRRGRAKQALAHFDAYLASSTGALTEEARYGRIRALRALGRSAQELASIEAFLADHADSIYAARLRKRAEELRP
ncbi:MAG: tetratricopeptide repeat protein [Myxococcales bacterium]|nr:tetratricopeptide repeat protein [Myxococcales bacterium]MCB9716578.1 tetratricopeptide repeat protein [Myxococcales bacterium]